MDITILYTYIYSMVGALLVESIGVDSLMYIASYGLSFPKWSFLCGVCHAVEWWLRLWLRSRGLPRGLRSLCRYNLPDTTKKIPAWLADRSSDSSAALGWAWVFHRLCYRSLPTTIDSLLTPIDSYPSHYRPLQKPYGSVTNRLQITTGTVSTVVN